MRKMCDEIVCIENIVDNGTSQIHSFLSSIAIYENAINSDSRSLQYIPPFHSDWLFIYQIDELVTVNITLTDEILKI